MIIKDNQRYNIDQFGVVTDVKSGMRIAEYRDQQNYRSVKLVSIKTKKPTKHRLDRLLLRTFSPIEAVEDHHLSVKYEDDDRDNLDLNNIRWDETWYLPEIDISVMTIPLNVWFKIPTLDHLEISLSIGWSVRNCSDQKIRSEYLSKDGYIFVDVGNGRKVGLHRLVALTFLPHPINPDHLVVNHKDRVRANNEINNLEWTTISGNVCHSFEEDRRTNQRVLMKDAYSGVIINCRSISSASKTLNTGFKSLSTKLSENNPGGFYFKGFLIKYIEDDTPWDSILMDDSSISKPALLKNSVIRNNYKIAVKDMIEGEVVFYNSINEVILNTGLTLYSLYRLLVGEYPIPWSGKCMRIFTGEPVKWPNYPLSIIEVFSKPRGSSLPIKVSYSSGHVVFHPSIAAFCRTTTTNVYVTTINKYLFRKQIFECDDFTIERINLKDYT